MGMESETRRPSGWRTWAKPLQWRSRCLWAWRAGNQLSSGWGHPGLGVIRASGREGWAGVEWGQ